MITCRTCGQRIIWCRTETGKRMPLDPEPHMDGNLVITSRELLPTVRPVSRANPGPGELRYRSHFASCKQATQHRRRAPKAKLPPPGPVLFEAPELEKRGQ